MFPKARADELGNLESCLFNGVAHVVKFDDYMVRMTLRCSLMVIRLKGPGRIRS